MKYKKGTWRNTDRMCDQLRHRKIQQCMICFYGWKKVWRPQFCLLWGSKTMMYSPRCRKFRKPCIQTDWAASLFNQIMAISTSLWQWQSIISRLILSQSRKGVQTNYVKLHGILGMVDSYKSCPAKEAYLGQSSTWGVKDIVHYKDGVVNSQWALASYFHGHWYEFLMILLNRLLPLAVITLNLLQGLKCLCICIFIWSNGL